VDYDVCTLDGSSTLHAMDVISITDPCSADGQHLDVAEVPVPRLPVIKSADVAKLRRIPHLRCTLPADLMAAVSFEQNFRCIQPDTISPSTNLDFLWHLGWFVQDKEDLRPSWAGFNDCVVRGQVTASVIRMHPIIDLNPNDLSSVYSTLAYIAKEAEKLNIKTPTVTFDQPLWLKAVNIVSAYKLNIVCRIFIRR